MIDQPTAAPRGPFQRGARRLALVLAFALVFGAGAGVERYAPIGGADAGAQSSFTELPEFQVVQETWDKIQEQYVAIDGVDDATLMRGAARGMVQALGDTGHSTYLDPEQARAYEEATRGELIGIGVQLDFGGREPTVVAPLDGSPAAEAGVRTGDVIVAIDGEATSGMSQGDISQAIRGEVGTTVELTLERPGQAQPVVVTLERQKITIVPVTWTMLPGDVALIRLSEFTTGAGDGVRDALIAAKAQGATALILDLRDNPGGLVFEAIGVANQFMPEGSVIYHVQERGRDPEPVPTFGDGEGRDLPMAVLINGGSASAAEVVASALQDNSRAELIGETTFGTGTLLQPFPLSDGSLVVLGTALWTTAAGSPIWHVGVTPSVEVAQPEGGQPLRPPATGSLTSTEWTVSTDAQLRAAYDSLRAP